MRNELFFYTSSVLAESFVFRNPLLRQAPKPWLLLYLTTNMNKILTGLLLTIILVSCDNRPTTTENLQDESKNIIDIKPIVELSQSLHGLWISDNYLNNIEKNKSIFLSRKYDTEIQGFYLDKIALQTDSAFLEGFTDHEGGYSSPIIYDNEKGKFVNDMARLPDYATFPDPFELNFDGNGKIEMYLPKTKKTDTYRKVKSNFQTEIRRLLIAGNYKTINNNSEIQFVDNGQVHNFKDFKYYELVADFGLNIEYDAIVFFKTLKGGNWSDGEIYKFEFISNSLHLQHVKTNWETMEHEISDEILVLDLE